MSCCGQKRRARGGASNPGTSRAAALVSRSEPRTAREPWRPADVMLRYLGSGTFSVRSTRTGRMYSCTGANPTVSVDLLDVESLLLTRLFMRM